MFNHKLLVGLTGLAVLSSISFSQAAVITAQSSVDNADWYYRDSGVQTSATDSVIASATDSDGLHHLVATGDVSGSYAIENNLNNLYSPWEAGLFEGESKFTWSEEVVNSEESAQSFTFDFTVFAGSLGVSKGNNGNADESASASYNLNIRLNGLSLWSSFMSVDSNGQITQANSSLGAYSYDPGNGSVASTAVAWDDYEKSLNLGVFSAGQSKLLSYEITTNTYLGRAADLSNSDSSSYWQSWVNFADPFELSSADFSVSPGKPTNVPEPGSLILLMLGAVALGVSRRRTM